VEPEAGSGKHYVKTKRVANKVVCFLNYSLFLPEE